MQGGNAATNWGNAATNPLKYQCSLHGSMVSVILRRWGMRGRGSVVYGLFFHQYICLTSSKRLTRQLANVLGDKWIKCCLYMSFSSLSLWMNLLGCTPAPGRFPWQGNPFHCRTREHVSIQLTWHVHSFGQCGLERTFHLLFFCMWRTLLHVTEKPQVK